MKIACDLDGVLVDFNTGFLRTLQQRSGVVGAGHGCGNLRVRENPARHRPGTWHWFLTYGHTPEQVSDAAAWTAQPDCTFWRDLRPLHDECQTEAFLWELTRAPGVEVYFVTARPGPTARIQSEDWLKRHGVYRPTVLVSAHKGRLASALALDLLIDDATEHADAVLVEAPTTRIALVEAAYNTTWRMASPMRSSSRMQSLPCRLEAYTTLLQTLGVLPSSFTLPPPPSLR